MVVLEVGGCDPNLMSFVVDLGFVFLCVYHVRVRKSVCTNLICDAPFLQAWSLLPVTLLTRSMVSLIWMVSLNWTVLLLPLNVVN